MTKSASATYRLENVRAAMGHYLLGRGAGAILGLANAVLLVRNMATPDYAAYIALLGIAGIAAMLTSLGLDRVVTRFVPEGLLSHGTGMLRRFVWRMTFGRLLAGILATAVLSFVWQWVTTLFEFVGTEQIPSSLAIFLLANTLFTLLSAILQSLIKQKLLTRMTVAVWGIRLFWILAAIYQTSTISLEVALWIMAVPELLGAVILLTAVHVSLRHNSSEVQTATGKSGNWPRWQEVRSLAGHSYAFSLLASVPQGYFMRTIVAATLPVETIAAYGFFSSLVDRLRNYLPIQLMYNLVEPVLVVRYLEYKNAASLMRNAQLMYKTNLLILAAALIFVLIGGSELVMILTNGRYIEQTWILALLMLQTISGSHVLALQLILNVLKANQLLSIAALYALAAMFAFLGFVFLSGHMMGILFGTLVYSLILNSVVLILMARREIQYRPFYMDIAKLAGIGAILVAGAHFLLGELAITSGLPVACAAAIFGTAFLFLCLQFGIVSRQELTALTGVIRAKRADS